MDPKRITYHETPEETAECGYCLHRDNVCAFELEGGGSECPKCFGFDDSPPVLDVPQIMEEAKVLAEAFSTLTAERDELRAVVDKLETEAERWREGVWEILKDDLSCTRVRYNQDTAIQFARETAKKLLFPTAASDFEAAAKAASKGVKDE